MLTACSGPAPTGSEAAAGAQIPLAATTGDGASANGTAPTADAATRTTPLVPGRPGRVFIFAGIGDNCQPQPDPQVTIAEAPQKGELSFRPGQSTTIAASRTGKCIGSTATGTGVYYTAREGTSGSDRFVLSARMPGGETMTRTFSVTIAP